MNEGMVEWEGKVGAAGGPERGGHDVFGFIALIQRLRGDKEGARQTEEAINRGISGLGRNPFLLKVLDDHDWW